MYIKSQMERIFSGAWNEKHGDQLKKDEEDLPEQPDEVMLSMPPELMTCD